MKYIFHATTIFIAVCYLSYSQDEPHRFAEKKIKDATIDFISGEQYYISKYTEFLESVDILNVVNKSISKNNIQLNEKQKLYFISGFVRGLIENATMKGFKSSKHTVKIHFIPLGENVSIERTGWVEGCKEGSTQGINIINQYKNYLEKFR